MANTGSRGRLIAGFALTAALALALYAVFSSGGGTEVPDGRIKVVATIFPVYDFARAVGGDRIELSMLLTPGMEAHSFEPKPSDVGRLSGASLFIYTSEAMEPWAAELVSGLGSGDLRVLEAGAGVPIIIDEQHEGEETEGTHGEGTDPHVWLDFENAEHMVRSIAMALTEVDPEGGGFYSDNAEAYCLRIEALDAEFGEAIALCPIKTIVHGGHYAFGYLAARYGLEYVAAQGFSPDSELGPRQISDLMSVLRQTGSDYVFYEELVEPRAAETISEETGAGMLMLHAGHNISKEEFGSGTTFVDLMRANLKNLKTGLGYSGN